VVDRLVIEAAVIEEVEGETLLMNGALGCDLIMFCTGAEGN